MAYWANLPTEIRLMILKRVERGYRFKSDGYARAGYASVCREWQYCFEQRNFRRIIVNQERIPDFERIMGRETSRYRRDYLVHLFLRVRLEDYDCTVCQSKEDDKTIQR